MPSPETKPDLTTRFRCSHCPKEFSRRENLARHARIHKPGKLHTCSVCGKEFTRSDVRQRHEEIHKAKRSSRGDSSPTSPNTPNTASHSRPALLFNTHEVSQLGNQQNHLPSSYMYHERTAQHQVSERLMTDTSIFPGSQRLHSQSETEGLSRPPTSNSTYHDQTPSWMTNAGNFENMWFDDDLVSALLEPVLPPFMEGTGSLMGNLSNNPPRHNTNHDTNSLDMEDVSPTVRSRSPPNEASEEDRWPYRWNPDSQAITSAKPIQMEKSHPLVQSHHNRFDISETRYERLKSFLREPALRGLDFHFLPLPDLHIANVFIRLFFQYFEHQMAVIHRPSLRSCDDLPDALLAAMIAIGAIYSRERHTCRFSIVLIDVARLSAQFAMELNNNLMRDPMFVYALTLICYSGLWCGNKRLFELSESLRGTVITYCRHLQLSWLGPIYRSHRTQFHSLDVQWKHWALIESKRRLSWVIYSLDCMFPCLLYLPSSLNMAEFMGIECPCDEEFWHATTAHRWKSLLGSALVPPGRTFSSAISPFLGPLNLGSAFDAFSDIPVAQTSFSNSIGLNSWTRYIVLITILVQVFEFSQQVTMVSEAVLDSDIWQSPEDITGSASHTVPPSHAVSQEIQKHYDQLRTRCTFQSRSGDQNPSEPVQEVLYSLAKRRTHITKMLLAWEQAYSTAPAADIVVFPASGHFHKIGLAHLQLGNLMLHVPILDLQNALGKSGPSGVIPAMELTYRILGAHPNEAGAMLIKCLEKMSFIQSNFNEPVLQTDSRIIEPPNIIDCFLSGVFVWTLVNSSNQDQAALLLQKSEEFVGSDKFSTTVKEILAWKANEDLVHSEESKTNIILYAVADILSQMAPWSASLNMALLLFHRGKAFINTGL